MINDMTVGDLIENLKEFDPTLKVVVMGSTDYLINGVEQWYEDDKEKTFVGVEFYE